MKKSFLRVEDWAPEISLLQNPFWNDFLRILEEFQQLIDTQKKQLSQSLKQQSQKRFNLIKQYYDYKRSLRYQGQLMINNITFLDSQKSKYFFSGYQQIIEEIIINAVKEPAKLADLLSHYKQYKKYNSFDFSQNLILTIYPCYLPCCLPGSMNKCLQFVYEVIQRWDYSVEQGRPLSYTIIDQIITGFLKSPDIICYVEKISMGFMKEINKCKMDFFAFDEQAQQFNNFRIKNQIEVKKNLAISMRVNNQPKSRWQKFTSFFKKKNDLEASDTFLSQTSEIADHHEIQINAADIMRRRQKDFINVVRKTIDIILEEEPPFFLKKMLYFFHVKIDNYYRQEVSITLQKKDKKKTSQKSLTEFEPYYRHYCYFLMTNLIFQELHNKFTIAHEDTEMTSADLQNITEIIRIMSNIFQGNLPQGDKYKNQSITLELKKYIPRIPHFYDNKFELNYSTRKIVLDQMNSESDTTIRQLIISHHENNYILSFNDVKIIIDALNEIKTRNKSLFDEFSLSKEAKEMKFLTDQKISELFDPNNKTIEFSNKKHKPKNILFMFNAKSITSNQIYAFYLGTESPLKNLPAFTNSLLYESNLTISQSLELTKSINAIKKLSLKELKYFLMKLAQRYQNLYLKNNQNVLEKFLEEIKIVLRKHLEQKSNMLTCRQQLLNKMGSFEKVIHFYCEQLQSSQFYDRISESFIHNIKIKLFLNIENDEFRVNSNRNDLKGMQLQGILISDKNKMKNNEDYILRNSFSSYSNIKELLKTITSNTITKAALTRGRRVDEFNDAFIKVCDIIVSYIQDFINKRQVLQNLSKGKLAKFIISKIQDHIFDQCRSDTALQEDIQLKQAKKFISIPTFFKELSDLTVDWDFLVDQCIRKFKIIMGQTSVAEKIKHFQQLFKMIFTIIGFTMPKNKISAEIINPIMQYLILRCPNIKHYECLYCLQCLKWNTNPETSYNITLYHSSLHYISKIMKEDYPL